MGRIIPLRDDPHERVETLLPWYSIDELEPDERAFVDSHLAGCARCRDEFLFEQRLRPELARLPLDNAGDWQRMRARADRSPPPRVDGAAGAQKRAPVRVVPLWRRPWAIAAQAACVMLAVSLVPSRAPDPRYHALGSPRAMQAGNLIVMFRPETSEQDMRRVLDASGARLVDGPTAAGAYILHVPSAAHDTALGSLRAQPSITLAQPIDPGPQR